MLLIDLERAWLEAGKAGKADKEYNEYYKELEVVLNKILTKSFRNKLYEEVDDVVTNCIHRFLESYLKYPDKVFGDKIVGRLYNEVLNHLYNRKRKKVEQLTVSLDSVNLENFEAIEGFISEAVLSLPNLKRVKEEVEKCMSVKTFFKAVADKFGKSYCYRYSKELIHVFNLYNKHEIKNSRGK